jgi:biopolymer transport protein ExbD
MNLRKRKEISGEMGMQSMTDIIFILLMFFMMTSTLVHPSALNLSLPANPKTSKKPPLKKDHLDDVAITASGGFLLNGKTTALETIKNTLKANRTKKSDYTITVSPDLKSPIEFVVAILDLTQQMDINSIIQADAE